MPNKIFTDAQQRAIDTEGKVLVSAAAGSGKTTAMLAKIVNLIGKGVPIRRILVCVYNTAGANELKEKLYQTLFECACGASGEQKKLYRNAMDDLPFCSVGTIHGFFQSLIRRNFDKLGLSPNFGVIDEDRHGVYMRRALESVFGGYFASGDELFATLSEALIRGRKEDSLSEIIFKLYGLIEIQPRKSEFFETVDRCYSSFYDGEFADILLNGEKRAAVPIAEECAEILRPLAALGQKSHAAAVENTLSAAKATLECNNLNELLRLYGGFTKLSGKRKGGDADVLFYSERAKAVNNAFGDRVKTLNASFLQIGEMESAHVQNAEYVKKLLEIVNKFSTELQVLKTKDEVLSFMDLERYAAVLVKYGYVDSNDYDYVFIDEYQDVNPTQEYVLSAVIGENSFMVGDIKQSIYGFRLADPAIFLSREKSYKSGGGSAIGFTKNFRSDKSILNFVNGLFDAVMTEASADVDYKNSARFETEDEEIGSNVQLHLFISRRAQKNEVSGVYDITEHHEVSEAESAAENEGRFIASEIGRLVNGAIEGDRRIDYRDIAVLFRSRSSAAQTVLHMLIKAGIPVDDSGFSKADCKETELISFLRAIDNPMQDLPFAGFLLSFFGGLNERELAEIAAVDGSCLYSKFISFCNGDTKAISVKNAASFGEASIAESAVNGVDTAIKSAETAENTKMKAEVNGVGTTIGIAVSAGNEVETTIKSSESALNSDDTALSELKQKISNIAAALKKYRLKAAFKNVAELTEGIISDFSYDAFMQKFGESAVCGIFKFIEKARAYDGMLGNFLRDYGESESKDSAPAGGGNCIKISTFHGFKGLEIPVVFVSDISCPLGRRSVQGDIIADGNGYIGIKRFDKKSKTKVETLSEIAVISKINEKSAKEEMRLLYVALTRAKSRMYITGSIGTTKLDAFGNLPRLDLASNNLDLISGAIFKRSVSVRVFKHEPEDFASFNESATAPLLYGGNNKIKQIISKSINFVYPHAEASRAAMKYSVSGLDGGEDLSPTIFAESAKTGIAYHKVMQNIDYGADSEERVITEIDDMLKKGILTANEAGTVNAADILKCLSSDIMKLARRSVCLREKKFMMFMPACELSSVFKFEDGVLVQGIADLIIDGEERYIVDFKNSMLTDSETLKKYKQQLYLYKTAVESAFSGKKFKTALYSFKTGQTFVFD